MEKTKTLAIVTTELRNFPIVETNWKDYPFYYKANTAMTIVLKDFDIKDVFKDDYIVWDKNDKIHVMRYTIWNKMYGKFLKNYLETFNKE